jgi:hypothetical protein
MPRGNPSAAAGGCNADEAASDRKVRSRFIFCGQPTSAKPQGPGDSVPRCSAVLFIVCHAAQSNRGCQSSIRASTCSVPHLILNPKRYAPSNARDSGINSPLLQTNTEPHP